MKVNTYFLGSSKNQSGGILGNDNIQVRVMSHNTESEIHTKGIQRPFKVRKQENYVINHQ